jgi:hypothetical protein
MPSRASYVLKVAGALKGAPRANARLIGDFQRIFPPRPPGRARRGGWPGGFVLGGYGVCLWSSTAEAYAPERDQTLLTFRSEISVLAPGQLYDNREAFLRHVRWFYHYREQPWHRELSARLRELNERYRDHIICPIWFRDWQWYCGNGGDGS